MIKVHTGFHSIITACQIHQYENYCDMTYLEKRMEVKCKEIVSVEINKLELRKNSIIKLLQIKNLIDGCTLLIEYLHIKVIYNFIICTTYN